MRLLLAPACLALVLLAGCDQLGIPTPASTAAKKDADSKAIGGACRHAGRAIEDCYTLNKKADKAAVYAGWREMNDYMRENSIEPVAPVIKPEPPASAPAHAASAASAAASAPDHDAEEADAADHATEAKGPSGKADAAKGGDKAVKKPAH